MKLLTLLILPHILVLAIGFMVCREMGCLIPFIYVLFMGPFYTLLIGILYFKFTNSKSKEYLFFLSLIYIYCGIGITTEGGIGYNYIHDIIMLSLGCSFDDYDGYCSKASMISYFYPPTLLLLLASLPFLFSKKNEN